MSVNDNKSGNENSIDAEDKKNDNSNKEDNNNNEDNNNSFEDNYSSYVENNNNKLNEINKIEDVETKSKKKKKIGEGSGFLHILPCKIFNENNSILAPVDEYFEKKIIEITDNNNDNNYQYNAHFRGRLLNGRKCSLNDNENNNINIHYYELEQNSQNKTEYKITQKRPINTYFLWKYDEIFENDSNTFMNIQKIINDLNCLS
jgi:hypothetical protein